jgi:hypothetical protein
MFSDTVRSYRQVVRLSKALAAPYFANVCAVLPVFIPPLFN